MIILKKPIISEKMTRITEKVGQYGFIVDMNANKLQIKKAVEAMYSVNVEAVNTMNFGGKVKSRGTKTGDTKVVKGRSKKAIVTLKKGEVIDFYSSI